MTTATTFQMQKAEAIAAALDEYIKIATAGHNTPTLVQSKRRTFVEKLAEALPLAPGAR